MFFLLSLLSGMFDIGLFMARPARTNPDSAAARTVSESRSRATLYAPQNRKLFPTGLALYMAPSAALMSASMSWASAG